MIDSLDTSATPHSDWHQDERAWIHLYYKILYQAILQYPFNPVPTNDTIAYGYFRKFFDDRIKAGYVDRAATEKIFKGMFIHYRNESLPNLLSKLVQACDKDRVELDSRVGAAVVIISEPMLNDYIEICGKHGLDNDPEPGKEHPDLQQFISALVDIHYTGPWLLSTEDTVVESFKRATANQMTTDQDNTSIAEPLTTPTGYIGAEIQADYREVQEPLVTQKKVSKKIEKKWLLVEHYALWRNINNWCIEHGVDGFDIEKMDKQTWADFAREINEECATRGQVRQRTGDSVRSQVRDAIRRANTVTNRPIKELDLRAKQMRKDIKDGKDISDDVRYPEEAIEISEDEEPGAGLGNLGTNEKDGRLVDQGELESDNGIQNEGHAPDDTA